MSSPVGPEPSGYILADFDHSKTLFRLVFRERNLRIEEESEEPLKRVEDGIPVGFVESGCQGFRPIFRVEMEDLHLRRPEMAVELLDGRQLAKEVGVAKGCCPGVGQVRSSEVVHRVSCDPIDDSQDFYPFLPMISFNSNAYCSPMLSLLTCPVFDQSSIKNASKSCDNYPDTGGFRLRISVSEAARRARNSRKSPTDCSGSERTRATRSSLSGRGSIINEGRALKAFRPPIAEARGLSGYEIS